MLDLFLNDGLSLDQYLEILENNFQQILDEKLIQENWDFSDYEKKWQNSRVALE
jgi:hypothetical protein